MSLSEEVQKLVNDNASQAQRIRELNGVIRDRGADNNQLRAELSSIRRANTHLIEQIDKLNSGITGDAKNRAWVISTWCAAHGLTKTLGNPDDMSVVNTGCVVELLDGLAAIDQGKFDEWKRKVTSRDTPVPDDVAELIQKAAHGPNTDAPAPSATVGEASNGVRTSHLEADNALSNDPVPELFIALAGLLQSSERVVKGQKIVFEFTKD